MTVLDDDARHLEGARRGEQRAFAALVAPYTEGVFGFLVRMIGDREEARDALRETLIRVWTSLDTCRHDGRFAAWMFTIARNAALDRPRSRRRLQVAPLEGDVRDTAASPEDQAEARAFVADLEASLAELPEARRAVFVMRQESGLTFREIAEALDIPLGTALSHMHHAVRALREALRHHEP